MAKKGKVQVSLSKLLEFSEALKRRPCIQVGVFSGKSAREGDLDNAALASIHEHGDSRHNLPPRSMLITPIKDHSKEIMSSIKGKAHELVETGKLLNIWKLVGIAAEKIILQAFDTGGFGKWPQLKNATIWGKLKGSMASKANKFWNIKAGNSKSGILIATGQLRRAFSSRVFMKH